MMSDLLVTSSYVGLSSARFVLDVLYQVKSKLYIEVVL
jgi:hypothetical protein